MKKRVSKRAIVREYFLEHKTITSKQAWDMFGESRLSDLILHMRREGYKIETHMIHPTDRWGGTCNCAEYHLIED